MSSTTDNGMRIVLDEKAASILREIASMRNETAGQALAYALTITRVVERQKQQGASVSIAVRKGNKRAEVAVP